MELCILKVLQYQELLKHSKGKTLKRDGNTVNTGMVLPSDS